MVLRAEAQGEEINIRTDRFDHVAVGVIHVLRSNRPGLGNIAHDVAVVVVARDEERTVNADGDETTHATRALFCAGEVVAPEVFDRSCRAIDEGDSFKDNVAAIIREIVRRVVGPPAICIAAHNLPHAEVLVIVAVLHGEGAFNGEARDNGDQTVLRVVGVEVSIILDEVAVGIVGKLTRRHGGTES